MKRYSGIDPFLFHVPDVPTSRRTTIKTRHLRGAVRGVAPIDRAASWLPVLVRVPHPTFQVPFELQDEFTETSRLGNVMSGRGTKSALTELGKLPGVVVEVSRDGGTWELDQSLVTVGGRDVQSIDLAVPEDQCIVGVIDGGIDPMHRAFLGRNGKTRLLYVWDQTTEGAQTPRAANLPFDYGALYTEADFNEALASGQRLVIAPQSDADHRVHGTHVASIAAGRAAIDPNVERPFAGGMAPDAPIVVVIPALQPGAGRPSEGFAKSHLDALSFIDAAAKQKGLPVVVNVSAGIAAGAHDGSSALEASFDTFTVGGHAAGRAVVKSAGNARDARRYRRFKLATDGTVTIPLRSVLSSSSTTTVEAWFSSAHDVELTVREGDRRALPTLSQQRPEVTELTQQGTAHLNYAKFHRDNGDTLLLLTLPATQVDYQLTFSGKAMRGQGEIDLWIEGPLQLETSTEKRTLTMPGSARTVITVASSDSKGRAIADSSSYGPTRDNRLKPEIFAPGIAVRAALAETESETTVLSGTSMAAPHVTGAIALLFSKHVRLEREPPNALQVRAALIATARGMDGNWREDRGYGLLDVRALLDAFEEPAASAASPGSAASPPASPDEASGDASVGPSASLVSE